MLAAEAQRLAARVEGGAVLAADDARIPATQRFLAGGDVSVRGYDVRGIGVPQPDGSVLPGRYLGVASLEWQRPVWLNGQRSAWETAVFADNEPNAFALPGGKVGVNTGIFTVAKNQDQLAAVLGHEIGHVIARHHEERITRQMGAQAGLGVLGALAGARYGEGAANTVNQLGGMTAQAAFLLPG